MPRGNGSKIKLFRILEYLFRATDKEHGVTVQEVIEKLAEQGIDAERKSVYDDFLTLGDLGFPVERMHTRPERYYLEERIFTLAELKLLVDAIQSTRFITGEKSRELIGKLELFAGEHHAGDLSRQVYVDGRVKSMNGTVMENVDGIHNAIRRKKRLSFSYFSYSKEKQKVYRAGGKPYDVSPAALLWDDEKYYLVAYDEKAGAVKNFRVDKMDNLSISKQNIAEHDELAHFNPAAYSNKIFGMYGGEETLVVLECAERLAGVILDRFGWEPAFLPQGDRFRVGLRVMLSPNFYAWVMSFGADMQIVSPPAVRAEFARRVADIATLYAPAVPDGGEVTPAPEENG